MTPPVVVVYSLSPLYLSSLLVGKRSTALKALLTTAKKEGIFYGSNLNMIVVFIERELNVSHASSNTIKNINIGRTLNEDEFSGENDQNSSVSP